MYGSSHIHNLSELHRDIIPQEQIGERREKGRMMRIGIRTVIERHIIGDLR